ncbi:MAG TPA: ABC transporter ATP-binding protein, partial [Pyrinomonadaceae bacterium]|nr:ABC transporter ATP-binding protein [Pyrinomonadaceae bacterium]
MAEPKKKIRWSEAWTDARELIWTHRRRLMVGAVLMIINQAMGLVLPASTKYLIDVVIGQGRTDLLWKIALAAGAATTVQAVTTFSLSQVLGVAAQRAITEMRKKVQQQISRLPISYFDSTQTGKLISRIMNDADGIRNLVGTGLVQLAGSFITAAVALGILFWLNWRLTSITILVLGIFGGALSYAFTRLRPLFRERGEITAALTGRLAESLGGIRIVKAYTAERREALTFARGAHKLFRNIAKSMTGVSATSAFSSVVVGAVGVVIILVGGNSVVRGQMSVGDLFMYVMFTGMMAMPLVQFAAIGTQITEAFAGLDRIREVLNMPTEDQEDADRKPLPEVQGEIEFDNVTFEYNPGVPVLKSVSFTAPAGSTTALVGSSGSGKSTLISLAMNFNRPLSGKIKVDGQDLQTLRLRDFRSYLGVVMQDNFLFDVT